MWFRTGAIVFKYGEILSLFEIINAGAFYIVTAIIKVACIVTQIVKYFQKLIIFFMSQADQSAAPT